MGIAVSAAQNGAAASLAAGCCVLTCLQFVLWASVAIVKTIKTHFLSWGVEARERIAKKRISISAGGNFGETHIAATG
jgi:hypothetical protein